MSEPYRLIDSSVKDSVLRYPTVELIRKLFPDVKLRGRSVLCNPLRDDRHPSLSCFRDRDGYSGWKDFATGEHGDNIDFYRLVYPEMTFLEALESLSVMLLGRSALLDVQPGQVVLNPSARQVVRKHVPAPEPPSQIEIVSSVRYDAEKGPDAVVSYVRGRGISDEVAGRYFSVVTFDNLALKGRVLMDPESGIPIVGADGKPQKDSGRFVCVALRNAVGAWSLRVPDTPAAKGFKRTNLSFPTFILADGSLPVPTVSLAGTGDGLVSFLRYDQFRKALYVNESQFLVGIEPWGLPFACVFLDAWSGRYLEGRDLRCACAVLSTLCGRVHRSVSVVEGMFDAASVIELSRMGGTGPYPGGDLVVLNSVTNLSWAVPFLAMHGEVHSLLDNDLGSKTGQRTYDAILRDVSAFAARAGVVSEVVNDSARFAPYKDMNEYLMAAKGFRRDDVPAAKPSLKAGKVRRAAVRQTGARRGPAGGGGNGLH